jgi:hypothetical protein
LRGEGTFSLSNDRTTEIAGFIEKNIGLWLGVLGALGG